MEYALSTHLFVGQRLTAHILDQILAAGLRRIEIFAARQHFDYHDSNQVRDVAQWFKDQGIIPHAVHAPLYSDFDWGKSGSPPLSVAYLERRLRIDSMDEIKRSLEVAERLPFPFLVLHMGTFDEEYDLRKFDAAFTSIEHLRIFAKERGVQILLENIPNQLASPERLIHFINYTRMEDLKVCFDTGHAHMTGDVQSAFQTLKSRIVSTHVHDNLKEKDDHLMPFDGGIDWEQTVRDFCGEEGKFPMLFELRNYGPEKSSLARVKETIDRLNAVGPAANPE